jgi:hypothetical protein
MEKKSPENCNPHDFYFPTQQKNCTTLYFSRYGAKFLKGSVMGVFTLEVIWQVCRSANSISTMA